MIHKNQQAKSCLYSGRLKKPGHYSMTEMRKGNFFASPAAANSPPADFFWQPELLLPGQCGKAQKAAQVNTSSLFLLQKRACYSLTVTRTAEFFLISFILLVLKPVAIRITISFPRGCSSGKAGPSLQLRARSPSP